MDPVTREELFLAAAAGEDVTLPEPVTRTEMFLKKIAENAGNGGGTSDEVHVGTEVPTDENIKLWVNPDDDGGVVSYETAQSLSEAQKAQARSNIGVYSIEQVDAALGSYIADIATLVGGDA